MMEGFSYNNIFETKGIEYLVIIGFFAVLIPFWLILNRQVVREQIRKTIGILTAKVLRIPQGLFYSGNHTWTHLESTGDAKVGLDDLLMHITGEVSFKSLREKGERISKGDPIAVMDHSGKTLTILSPVSGEITVTNQVLKESPGLVNEDPYIKGWMYKIKPSDWTAETGSYYLAADATVWFERELERFRDFLAVSAARLSPGTSSLVLQDGGELTDNPLSDLPDEVWRDFQKHFLNK